MKFLIISLVFFSLSLSLSHFETKPRIVIAKQNEARNYNSQFLTWISMGNRRMLADWLWVQTLIEGDIEHYAKEDFNNWMFLRFKTIIELDPQFLQAYQFGGQYLSIIKDDDQGAKYIYDRGLAQFPDDFFLNLNGGFHYFYELNDRAISKRLFEKIMFHPRAPKQLPSIVARMNASEGDTQLALELLQKTLDMNQKTPLIRDHVIESIESLRVELDLKCLNEKKTDCNKMSFKQIKYLINHEGKYYYPFERELYRIKKKKEKKAE